MRKKYRVTAVIFAAMLAFTSCSDAADPPAPGVTPPARETPLDPAESSGAEIAYKRVTFSDLASGSTAGGNISIKGYTSGDGTYIQSVPPICRNNAPKVTLDASGCSAPSGRLVEIKGQLVKTESGWTLRADTAESTSSPGSGDWNQFADIFPVYSGVPFTEAYSGYDSYIALLCTWPYMTTGNGDPLVPEQAAAMLEDDSHDGFIGSAVRAAEGHGMLEDLFREYTETSSDIGVRAMTALKDGGYSYDEGSGRYACPEGEDYGREYSLARRKLLDGLAEAFSVS